jgi:hypothetical protein
MKKSGLEERQGEGAPSTASALSQRNNEWVEREAF